jgi:hypothetical protein
MVGAKNRNTKKPAKEQVGELWIRKNDFRLIIRTAPQMDKQNLKAGTMVRGFYDVMQH